jgi:protein-tyrosine phosphatase
MTHGATPPFHVLYVCRANQCRSVMAEFMLAAAFGADPRFEGVDWRVSSAGVAARTGVPVHPGAARVLDEREIPHDDFASRQLAVDLVETADLILTAERAHRSAVLRVGPGAIHRTFTMRQFARLTATVGAEMSGPLDGPQLVGAALTARGDQQPVDPAQDDIADPVGGPIRGFRRCADEIAGTLAAFGVWPGPPTAGRGWWRRNR